MIKIKLAFYRGTRRKTSIRYAKENDREKREREGEKETKSSAAVGKSVHMHPLFQNRKAYAPPLKFEKLCFCPS